jgi:hypothetical protein
VFDPTDPLVTTLHSLRVLRLITRLNRLFSQTIDKVTDSQDRVTNQHSRTGVSHDGANLFSLRRAVAVDGAVDTRRLPLLKRAFLKALQRIMKKRITFGAESIFPSVLSLAGEANHRVNCSPLSCDSRMRVVHIWQTLLMLRPSVSLRLLSGQGAPMALAGTKNNAEGSASRRDCTRLLAETQ